MQFDRHHLARLLIQKVKMTRSQSKLTQRALEVVNRTTSVEELSRKIKHLQQEDLHNLAMRLPDEKRSNPKYFFKVIGAFIKSKSQAKCVNGISHDGKIIQTELGIEMMVKNLYCPEVRKYGGRIIDEQANLPLETPVVLTDDRVLAALEKLSKNKAAGVDVIPDSAYKDLLQEEDISWFTAKMN